MFALMSALKFMLQYCSMKGCYAYVQIWKQLVTTKTSLGMDMSKYLNYSNCNITLRNVESLTSQEKYQILQNVFRNRNRSIDYISTIILLTAFFSENYLMTYNPYLTVHQGLVTNSHRSVKLLFNPNMQIMHLLVLEDIRHVSYAFLFHTISCS